MKFNNSINLILLANCSWFPLAMTAAQSLVIIIEVETVPNWAIDPMKMMTLHANGWAQVSVAANNISRCNSTEN